MDCDVCDCADEKEKNKMVYSKSEIVDNVARCCRVRLNVVEKVFAEIEYFIMERLSDADGSNDVVLKLFDGMSLSASFVPEKEKLNNLTGETITTTSKIAIKANVTKTYKNKVSEYAKHKNDMLDASSL